MRQMFLLLATAALAGASGRAADAKPADAAKEFPAVLKGDWGIVGAVSGGHAVTAYSSPIPLAIGDGSAEWKSLPLLEEKGGKGVLTAKAGDGNTGALELTIGENVYKGIYQITKVKSTKDDAKPAQDELKIAFGAAGADAPKEMPKDPISLPKDVKYAFTAYRK